ncbi:MAG TPA: hypothetical protein VGM67_00735 [Gemmatimonadaceae bacterium]|jgi:hypothetical protein
MRLPKGLILAGLACTIAACGRSAPGNKAPAPATQPLAHALSGLAAQHVVVLPAYGVHVMPGLDWTSAIGRPLDVARTLDADILAALDERGLRKTWIFPDQLVQSYRRNSAYATDPYGLAEEPLRTPGLSVDARLPEPLASQLRTVIALHDDARLVLAPVDLRFEKAGTGGKGVLRLVLIDPRYSSVSWVGEISSDPQPAFGPAISAGIAAQLANVVSVP